MNAAGYQQTWAEFWAPLLTNDDGTLDVDGVKREMHDWHLAMGEVSEVYNHIAGLSKPNTAAVHITAAHDKAVDDAYKEGYAEAVYDAGRGHGPAAAAALTWAADRLDRSGTGPGSLLRHWADASYADEAVAE